MTDYRKARSCKIAGVEPIRHRTATQYAITIQRVFADGEYVFKASVQEFPHLFEYADTYAEAYELMIDAIETLEG